MINGWTSSAGAGFSRLLRPGQARRVDGIAPQSPLYAEQLGADWQWVSWGDVCRTG
jgi:hypothetical protein